MARPLERPADWVAFAGDEHPNRARACPGEDEELALTDHGDRWLDGYSGVGRLRNRQERDQGRLYQVDDVVVLLVCDT